MSRFSNFDCSVDVTLYATHCIPLALNHAGRTPHDHEFRVTVGWSHECSFESGGFTWDADEAKAKVWATVKRYDHENLNDHFTHPTVEVLAADLLDRLPAYFDWVEVSHRPDYRARITRRHLSQEWLANFRKTWEGAERGRCAPSREAKCNCSNGRYCLNERTAP